MAEVPEQQPPLPPAPEPRPQPPQAAAAEPPRAAAEPPEAEPLEPDAPSERWNPFKTPFAYLVLLCQIGVVVWAGYKQTQIGGTFENFGQWIEMHGWTLRDMTQVWSQPWKLLTCLVIETMTIQVIMNVMIWWSAGPQLERIFKTHRLAFLYIVGGLGCFFACDFLHYYFPHTFGVAQGRSAARHAVIACSGSVVGLLLAVEGPLATLKSKLLWSQIFSLALAWVISQGLSRGGAQVGLDLAGMGVDLVGGSIFGFALGLTLLRGAKKIVGYLFCLFLLGVVGVEGLVEGGRAYFSDGKAFSGQKSANDGSRGGSISGTDPRRVPEEAATPKPSLPDEETDPPEIGRKRKDAAAFLALYGILPTPSGNPEDQRGARAKRDALIAFEDRWTKSASANLEVEIAELSVVCGDLKTAESRADQAIKLLSAGLTPTKALGTIRARRIARLFGVLAICSIKMKSEDPDLIAAEAQLKNAEDWDPQLLEVHFFLGKISQRGSAQRKKELQLYLQSVGAGAPEWQQERVVEAKQLLDVE